MGRPDTIKKEIIFRALRKIDSSNFKKDIEGSSLFPTTSDCVEILANAYNMNIRNIIDKHVPQQTKIVASWRHAPWYNNTLREAKRMRRRCKRKYNKSKLLKDRQTYFKQCKSVYKMLNDSKRKYISSKIRQHEGNSKDYLGSRRI